MAEEGLTLTERRRLRLKQEIEQTAFDLFIERGFADVTVNDIVDVIGISSRTFFRHFATKEDVIVDGLRRDLYALADLVEARPAEEGAIEALRQAALELARRLEVDSSITQVWAQLLLENPGLVERAMAIAMVQVDRATAAVAARLGLDPATDLAPNIISGSMLNASSIAYRHWLRNAQQGSLVELTAQALDLVEFGVGNHAT